jgi:hypothetical protein
LPLDATSSDVIRGAAITVHTYNQSLAQAIFSRLPMHAAAIERWLMAMEERASEKIL